MAKPLRDLHDVELAALSAAGGRQLAAWERVVAKLVPLAPDFFARHTPAARAYQLRYLARRAVSAGDGREALHLQRVQAALAPRSLLTATLRFEQILIDGARLQIRRELGWWKP